MSHLSTVRTQIKDLDILARALKIFGQGILTPENDPLAVSVIAMDSRETPCVGVILPLDQNDNPVWRIEQKCASDANQQTRDFMARFCEIGIAPQEDGTYAFVGDLTYPWQDQQNNYASLPNAWGWSAGTNRRDHSYSVLMREYAVQTGLTLAEQQGMGVVQLPAEVATYAPHALSFGVDLYARPSLGQLLAQTPPEATVLLLTGGYLPPHMTIIFTANPDGTSSIAVDGGTDSSCYTFTKPFEDALGTVLGDVSTLDTCHVLDQGEMVHIGR